MIAALNPKSSALLVIDLQTRIVDRPDLGPWPGREVVKRVAVLAERFRDHGAAVVVVQVERPNVEQPPGSELVDEARPRDGEPLVIKRCIGAFTGTELQDVLTERGIDTVVVAGIATTMGVESTARVASDLGYRTILPSDAMTGLSTEEHEFALSTVLPRFGEVVEADQIVFA